MTPERLHDLAVAQLGGSSGEALPTDPRMRAADGFLRPPVDEALREEIDGLRSRLETQAVIEQAKGLLIGYYGIAPDAAFAVLRRWSQASNVKLRVLAADLVVAAAQAHRRPFGAMTVALSTEVDRLSLDESA